MQKQEGWLGMKMGTWCQCSPQLAVGWPTAAGGTQLALNATGIREGSVGWIKSWVGKGGNGWAKGWNCVQRRSSFSKEPVTYTACRPGEKY